MTNIQIFGMIVDNANSYSIGGNFMISVICSVLTVNFLYTLFMNVLGLSFMSVNVKTKITQIIIVAVVYYSFLGC